MLEKDCCCQKEIDRQNELKLSSADVLLCECASFKKFLYHTCLSALSSQLKIIVKFVIFDRRFSFNHAAQNLKQSRNK